MSSFGHDEVFLPLRALDAELRHIAALRRDGKLVEALEAVRSAAADLFGPLRFRLEQVDTESAARLLVSPERIAAASALFAETAEIHRIRDENGLARACFRRALEFLLEGVLLGGAAPRGTIAMLRSRADEWRLPRRYQDVLAQF